MTPEIILHTNYRPSMELSAQDIGKHMKRLKLNDARGISTKGQRSRLRDMNTYETSLQDRFKQDASQKAEVSLKDEEFTSVDNPVLSFFGPATKNVIKRSERFTEQEYNLYEYGRIIDTEALVARTFTKKKGLMFSTKRPGTFSGLPSAPTCSSLKVTCPSPVCSVTTFLTTALTLTCRPRDS